ncbi:MAG TPA: hypothetical protein VF432_07120, partial [Thermoanaerobaculia bacterium]
MKRRFAEFSLTALAYALFWTITRWPAISVNVLFLDDFEIPLRPADFYLGPYRPVLWVNYLLWDTLIPNHFWTIVPKIYGAVYIGIAAAIFAVLLREWDVDRWTARLLPLVVTAHPILADGPLWQTYCGIPLAAAFTTAGAIAWSRGRRAAFTIYTLLGVFSYQIYVALAAVYAIAEPVVRRKFRLRDTAIRLSIIAAIAVAQLVLTALVRRYYDTPDPRGLATSFDLRVRFHFFTDLMVNAWMPVIAYYTGALRAMSLWKFVPIAIAALTAIRTRRVVDTLFAAVVFVIPALPNMALSQSAYAWRVATPEAYALAVSILPLLMRVPRAWAMGVIGVLTAVMVPVSHYESWCRKESWLRDQQFVASMRDHWKARPFTVVLAPVNPLGREDRALIGPRELTWGYEIRTSRMWSEFNDPWMTTAFVQNWAKLPFVDCNKRGGDPRCADAVAACARGCTEVDAEYPGAIHDDATARTIVCPTKVVPKCATLSSRASSEGPG